MANIGLQSFWINVVRKRSKDPNLTETRVHRLKGSPGCKILKVAFEQDRPNLSTGA